MAGREAACRARRERGLKKKATELATLCGIDVCIVVRGKDGSVFFSTDDIQEARRIAQRYVDSVAVGEKSKKRECPEKGDVFCGSHSGQRKRQKKEYSCVAASSKSRGMAENQVRNAGEDTLFSPSLLRELEFLLKTSPDIPHPEAFSAGKDIQASSILLDDKFEVRLGSLGEICTKDGDQHQNVISRLLRKTTEQGTSGILSAACTDDVYCLGKVLLELVTGELGFSGSNDASTNEWLERTLPCINIFEKELVLKILDPSLVVDDDLLEEVWAMAIVAKSCLNPKPSRRPPVRYILKALENPLRVVREEYLGSARLRATSSRGSWNATFFGSWRHSSSDIASVPGPTREATSFKYSATTGSQGSVGDQSFNHRRSHNEIFPDPSVKERDIV